MGEIDKYSVGLIRVMTLDSTKKLEDQGRLIENLFPKLKVYSYCIPDQYEGIYNDKTEEIARPKIIELAQEVEAKQVDAIIISCAADPAIEEIRKKAKIPVVGGGSAAAYLSICLSYKSIGVIGIGDSIPVVIKNILRERLAGYRKIPEITNVSELSPAIAKDSLNQAKELIDEGADLILLACAGLATIGLADIICKKLGVIVVDPVSASGSVVNYVLSCFNKKGV